MRSFQLAYSDELIYFRAIIDPIFTFIFSDISNIECHYAIAEYHDVPFEKSREENSHTNRIKTVTLYTF